MAVAGKPLIALALVVGIAAGAVGMRLFGPETPLELSTGANQASWPSRADQIRLESEIARLEDEAEMLWTQGQHWEQEADTLAGQAATFQARVGELNRQLIMADSTKQQLADDLTALQEDNARLREQLAFFEELIPTAGGSRPISIRQADAQVQPDGLHYRVLVMRNSPATAPFEGRLEFSATGRQGGSSATMTLKPAASPPSSQALRFQQYLRAEGVLSVPPDFQPDTLTIRVLEGRNVRSQHTIELTPRSTTP